MSHAMGGKGSREKARRVPQDPMLVESYKEGLEFWIAQLDATVQEKHAALQKAIMEQQQRKALEQEQQQLQLQLAVSDEQRHKLQQTLMAMQREQEQLKQLLDTMQQEVGQIKGMVAEHSQPNTPNAEVAANVLSTANSSRVDVSAAGTDAAVEASVHTPGPAADTEQQDHGIRQHSGFMAHTAASDTAQPPGVAAMDALKHASWAAVPGLSTTSSVTSAANEQHSSSTACSSSRHSIDSCSSTVIGGSTTAAAAAAMANTDDVITTAFKLSGRYNLSGLYPPASRISGGGLEHKQQQQSATALAVPVEPVPVHIVAPVLLGTQQQDAAQLAVAAECLSGQTVQATAYMHDTAQQQAVAVQDIECQMGDAQQLAQLQPAAAAQPTTVPQRSAASDQNKFTSSQQLPHQSLAGRDASVRLPELPAHARQPMHAAAAQHASTVAAGLRPVATTVEPSGHTTPAGTAAGSAMSAGLRPLAVSPCAAPGARAVTPLSAISPQVTPRAVCSLYSHNSDDSDSEWGGSSILTAAERLRAQLPGGGSSSRARQSHAGSTSSCSSSQARKPSSPKVAVSVMRGGAYRRSGGSSSGGSSKGSSNGGGSLAVVVPGIAAARAGLGSASIYSGRSEQQQQQAVQSARQPAAVGSASEQELEQMEQQAKEQLMLVAQRRLQRQQQHWLQQAHHQVLPAVPHLLSGLLQPQQLDPLGPHWHSNTTWMADQQPMQWLQQPPQQHEGTRSMGLPALLVQQEQEQQQQQEGMQQVQQQLQQLSQHQPPSQLVIQQLPPTSVPPQTQQLQPPPPAFRAEQQAQVMQQHPETPAEQQQPQEVQPRTRQHEQQSNRILDSILLPLPLQEPQQQQQQYTQLQPQSAGSIAEQQRKLQLHLERLQQLMQEPLPAYVQPVQASKPLLMQQQHRQHVLTLPPASAGAAVVARQDSSSLANLGLSRAAVDASGSLSSSTQAGEQAQPGVMRQRGIASSSSSGASAAKSSNDKQGSLCGALTPLILQDSSTSGPVPLPANEHSSMSAKFAAASAASRAAAVTVPAPDVLQALEAIERLTPKAATQPPHSIFTSGSSSSGTMPGGFTVCIESDKLATPPSSGEVSAAGSSVPAPAPDVLQALAAVERLTPKAATPPPASIFSSGSAGMALGQLKVRADGDRSAGVASSSDDGMRSPRSPNVSLQELLDVTTKQLAEVEACLAAQEALLADKDASPAQRAAAAAATHAAAAAAKQAAGARSVDRTSDAGLENDEASSSRPLQLEPQHLKPSNQAVVAGSAAATAAPIAYAVAASMAPSVLPNIPAAKPAAYVDSALDSPAASPGCVPTSAPDTPEPRDKRAEVALLPPPALTAPTAATAAAMRDFNVASTAGTAAAAAASRAAANLHTAPPPQTAPARVVLAPVAVTDGKTAATAARAEVLPAAAAAAHMVGTSTAVPGGSSGIDDVGRSRPGSRSGIVSSRSSSPRSPRVRQQQEQLAAVAGWMAATVLLQQQQQSEDDDECCDGVGSMDSLQQMQPSGKQQQQKVARLHVVQDRAADEQTAASEAGHAKQQQQQQRPASAGSHAGSPASVESVASLAGATPDSHQHQQHKRQHRQSWSNLPAAPEAGVGSAPQPLRRSNSMGSMGFDPAWCSCVACASQPELQLSTCSSTGDGFAAKQQPQHMQGPLPILGVDSRRSSRSGLTERTTVMPPLGPAVRQQQQWQGQQQQLLPGSPPSDSFVPAAIQMSPVSSPAPSSSHSTTGSASQPGSPAALVQAKQSWDSFLTAAGLRATAVTAADQSGPDEQQQQQCESSKVDEQAGHDLEQHWLASPEQQHQGMGHGYHNSGRRSSWCGEVVTPAASYYAHPDSYQHTHHVEQQRALLAAGTTQPGSDTLQHSPGCGQSSHRMAAAGAHVAWGPVMQTSMAAHYAPGGPAATMMNMMVPSSSSSSMVRAGGTMSGLLGIVKRVLMLVCPNSWQWLLLIATSVVWGLKRLFGGHSSPATATAAASMPFLMPVGAAGIMHIQQQSAAPVYGQRNLAADAALPTHTSYSSSGGLQRNRSWSGTAEVAVPVSLSTISQSPVSSPRAAVHDGGTGGGQRDRSGVDFWQALQHQK